MINHLKARARALLPKNQFARGVSVLVGGTASAQALSILATPLLTRLYSPEDFGLLATYSSLLALINVVSSLRYELSIAVAKNDDEAIALVWLCFVLVAISAGLTALGVGLLGTQLVNWLHQPKLKSLLWLIPIAVLLSGLYQPLSYWAIRHQQFSLLAQTKFRQSFVGVVIKLVAAHLGTIGLLLGVVVEQSVGSWQILSRHPLHCRVSSRNTNHLTRVHQVKARLSVTFSSYSYIALPNTLAGVLNSLYPAIFSILLTSIGAVDSLGMLYLAKKVIDAPSAILSKSIGDVFMAKISQTKDELVFSACIRNILIMAVVSSFFLVPYALALSFIGPMLFGSIWEPRISNYFFLLVPTSVAQLSVGSTGMAFITAGLNNHGLFAQAGMLLTRLSPIFLILFLKRPVEMLPIGICLGLLVGYLFYGSVLILSLRRKYAVF
ncbi:oligosaccharide flippase family protein [Nodularia spumigena CS-586/05]|uniref:lipopolysaccharide biosynthesis protein n=1 Tax=Nodularia spumigena TaxID=70799 RepID=UPI00232EE388|nr:oligosaccharide flippase family protein [Nodularia spumigena]MDB9342437.1 oligosaccharide flippase family protein [Nodularia spumigena CS-588/06]MDB9371175.1 oligosaccharide flippase family protein [Nodularia spumigena CS-586/05]